MHRPCCATKILSFSDGLFIVMRKRKKTKALEINTFVFYLCFEILATGMEDLVFDIFSSKYFSTESRLVYLSISLV